MSESQGNTSESELGTVHTMSATPRFEFNSLSQIFTNDTHVAKLTMTIGIKESRAMSDEAI